MDSRIEKLGQLLTHYSLETKKGDQVVIRGSFAAKPLMLACYEAVIQAGGHPHLWMLDSEFEELLLKHGDDDQLSHISMVDQTMIEKFDGFIGIRADLNTRTLARIDPARQQLKVAAYGKLMEPMMRRGANRELKWVATLFPTYAHAQDADMSLAEFETFVYDACLLNHDNPVAEWERVSAEHDSLIDWLAPKERVKVVGPNVDLTLSIKGRKFINGNGKNNMPCGEIFTGPVEQSVNGWIRYSYPAIYQGREVDGIEFNFVDGQIVKAHATKNDPFLQEMLNIDAGARYLGEFAIGTNRGIQQFTRQILFDEKIGGTIHLAIGRSYPESGGVNQSKIHWDMICDMRDGGQIWVDDELFYESGRFLVN